MTPLRHVTALVLLLIAISASVQACSVPVFRYGLEHWAPDQYEALVFHRGELTEGQLELVEQLRGRAEGGATANVTCRTVDLDRPDAAEAKPVWEKHGAGLLPRLIVRPEARTGIHWMNVSLPLTQASVTGLLDSPARRKIVERLAEGESVVWLLLESGDEEADRRAAERLDGRLTYLGSVLKLPELSAADIANGLVSVGQDGLQLKFSSLRVSRDDAAERVFVQMLLGVEDDLMEIRQPMVFPVFGQGRALYALVGDGINNAMIDQAAIFLVGSCSCEVKEQNPGVDLLMTADWTGMVERQASNAPVTEVEAEAVFEAAKAAAPELVVFSDSPKAPPPEPASATGFRFGLLFIILLAGIIWFWIRNR